MLKGWIISFAALVGSVLLVVYLVPGVRIENGIAGAATVAVIFAVVNLGLGTVIRMVTLPYRILTFGALGLVINGAMFYVTQIWASDLKIDSPVDAFFGALIITFASGAIAFVAKKIVKRIPVVG